MGGDTSAVTMKTLAERLGVSVTTISNAYSKPDRLSAELREQILAEARSIGYCGPSAAGRALRSGRTDVCAFLFGGELFRAFSDPYTVVFLSGLSEALEEYGASVLLIRAADDGGNRLSRAAIDAIVVGARVIDHPDLALLQQRGIRVVSTQRHDSGDWVGINDVKAGRLVGKLLARLGHQQVVAVVTNGHPISDACRDVDLDDLLSGRTPISRYEVERLTGLRDKLPQGALRVVQAGYNTREAGRAAAAYALDVQDRPTAVVALSDVLALGVWDAANERGLTPGRELSIAGFDDIPDAGFLGITTVRQPIAEKGRLVGRLAMDPDYPERQVTLPIELVVRSSTGPAPRM